MFFELSNIYFKMSFSSLKKNDVIFCESKNSRVIKLISKDENKWRGNDIFTNEGFEITSQDNFKVVTRERKTRPISMVNLFESEGVPSTLTEKEVMIVEYIQEEMDPSNLNRLERKYLDNNLSDLRELNMVADFLKYLGVETRYAADELLCYALCAIENEGKEISTSTPIKRFYRYDLRRWEIREQVEYTSWAIEFCVEENSEKLDEIKEHIEDHFWDYNPDSMDSDYGDSEHIGWEDTSINPGRPVIIR
jgi:hypothetical protein